MGGCRCAYRKCQNSTAQCPTLHYFHFPVRDPPRCDQWIVNARRLSLRRLSKERLRNKVVCSVHFAEKCFTNIKQDRLVHNAVPTLGFEDDDSPVEDPLTTGADAGFAHDDNIMLIPVNGDNTKFTLPDVSFSGMSYTIHDDNTIVPSSAVQTIRNNNIKMLLTRQVPRKMSVIKKEPVEPVFFSQQNNNRNQDNGLLSSNSTMKQLQIEQQNQNQLLKEFEDSNIELRLKSNNEYTLAIPTNEAFNPVPGPSSEPVSNVNSNSKITYIRMINRNTKQIARLKNQIRKQNKVNRLIMQRNVMTRIKPRRFSRALLLESLKRLVKPSLLAILKLELLPVDDVVLTDEEEKFITDLYMESPECYQLLQNKWKWNLPAADIVDKNEQ